MKPLLFVNRIRKYAVFSFLLPLIAINACFGIYKYLGNLDVIIFPNYDYSKSEQTLPWGEFEKIHENKASYNYTNCPKYKILLTYISNDNQVVTLRKFDEVNSNILKVNGWIKNNKVKTVSIKYTEILHNQCVKNYQSLYSAFQKFPFLETFMIQTIKKNPGGYAKIKNPYIYGEVSISRTAREFPSIYIFKTLIILSAFLLFLYWRNGLYLFNELKNNKILVSFSKNFFYLGLFSCIFLTLHATFLGTDIDSKLFQKARRLIIILFIFFEISAQILLTKNLFNHRVQLKKYINPLILKIKVAFVIIVFFITILSFSILALGDPTTSFKHILEWNYFSFLLIYYLLSFLLWRPSVK